MSDEVNQQIQEILNTLNSMNNGAEDIQNALNALLQQGGGTDGSGQIVADMVNRSVASVTQVLNNCSESITNLKNMYTNSLVPQMDGVLNSVSQMLGNVTLFRSRSK